MRVITTSVAGALVLALGLWILPPYLVRAPDAATIAALARAQGVALEVQGAPRFHLFPYPQLRLRGVVMQSDSLNAEMEALHYGVRLADMWNGNWQPYRLDARRGKAQLKQIDYRARLTDLPFAVLAFEDMQITLPQERALPVFSGRLARINESGYELTLANADTNISARIDALAEAKSVLELTMRLGDAERLTLEGTLQQSPHLQLDAEIELAARPNLKLLGTTPINMTGFLVLTEEELRAENLSLDVFGKNFHTRLMAFWQPDTAVQFQARLATDEIELDSLRRLALWQEILEPRASAPEPALHKLLRDMFFGELTGTIEIESARAVLADETARNLAAEINIADSLRLNKLSADLPFNTAALLTGDINFNDTRPDFSGHLSLRSLDSAAFLRWFGALTNSNLTGFAQRVGATSETSQRLGFISDWHFSRAGLRFNDMRGALGDTDFVIAANIDGASPLRGAVRVNLAHLDLDEWNLAHARRVNNNRFFGGAWFWSLNIEPLVRAISPESDFAIELAIDDMRLAQEPLGTLAFSSQIAERKLTINELQLRGYFGNQTQITGALMLDARQPYGELAISLAAPEAARLRDFLLPPLPLLPLELTGAVNLDATLYLPAPSAPDWTHVRFAGTGEVAGIALDYSLRTPSRRFDMTTPESTASLSARAPANRLAQLFHLPALYDKKQEGSFTLTTETQAPALTRTNARLALGNDAFAFAGLARPASDKNGYRLEGTGNIDYAHAPQINGKLQLNLTSSMASFSNIEMQVAGGALTGEGSFSDNILAANINWRGFDATPYLPQYNKGWSREDMRWQILSAMSANLELSLEDFTLGVFPIKRVAGSLRWHDGVLEAPALETEVLGGSGTLALQAEGGALTPSFALEAHYENVKSDLFLKYLFNDPLLVSTLSGSAAISGRGSNQRALMRSLSGTISLTGEEGRFVFTDPATPFARVLSVSEFADGRLSTQSTEFITAEGEEETTQDITLEGAWNILNRNIEARFVLPDKTYKIGGTITAPKIAR